MDAPNPTFAQMASRATRGHTGEEDGSSRKRMAENDPNAAKVRRSFLRCGATMRRFERGKNGRAGD